MRKQFFYFIVIFGIFMSCPVHSQEQNDVIQDQNTIIWMEAEFPPGYIHYGPNKGTGYEDVITNIFQDHMTDYTHNKMICNLARMNHEFKQGKQVCNVALFKTPEREEFMYFSIPSTFTLPNQLITTKNKMSLFSNTKTIRLEDVLKTSVKLGISRDRSYGKNIDEVLRKYKDQKNIFIHSGKDVFESLLKMLMTDRVDCILGLPEEAIYVAEDVGVKSQIISIALKENENAYETWLGYVACSKTDWGKQIIERINQILLEQRPSEKYRAAYERWLDQNSIENYRKLYDEIFLKTHE